MERDYQPLPVYELGDGAGFHRPMQSQAERVGLDSPALHVMTDLTRTSPATIRPQAPLTGANELMITRGVRLLLVADDREKVLGIITATDLQGEHPVQVAVGRGMRRDELTVADVMIDAAQVDVLRLADVENARVGHVLETLRRSGRQHALVVDAGGAVRGIFSVSQIARQLGVTLAAAGEVARTFAQIESMIR